MSERKLKQLSLIQIGFSLFGAALSLYLLVHHTRVKLGIQDSSSFCSFGRMADCDIVNASKYSEVSGVPLASLGAFYFFLLIVLGLVAQPNTPPSKLINRLTAWLGVLALVFDIFLLVGVQWLTLGSFCLLCILTYFANLGHLAVGFYRSYLEKPSHPFQNLFWGDSPWRLEQFSKRRIALSFSILIIFGFLIAAIPSWIQTKASDWENKKLGVEEFSKQWRQTPPSEIKSNSWDGNYGNPQAKLKLVVFSDFQCPFCKKAAFSLHTLLPSFKDDLYVTFKHFPLDSSCNPIVPRPMHLYACSLARLGTCASEKGKFWDYHDIVFMDLEDGELEGGWDKLRKKLSSIFTSEEIDVCLKKESSLEQVREDIQIGLDLGISGTPALFVNGRALTIPLDLETLRYLIKLAKENG